MSGSATPSQAVVWDFGGVLLHWQPGALVRAHRLGDAGLSDAELADQFFAGFGGDWAEFDRGALGRDEVVASIANRTGWSKSAVAAVVDAVPLALQVDPNTMEILHTLRQAGLRTYFLSNMPAPYADALEARHAWLGDFADGVFSSREGLVKPDPEIFALAEKRFELPPAATVFIDDNQSNVQAASAAGWQAILYRDAADLRVRLSATGLLRSRASA